MFKEFSKNADIIYVRYSENVRLSFPEKKLFKPVFMILMLLLGCFFFLPKDNVVTDWWLLEYFEEDLREKHLISINSA